MRSKGPVAISAALVLVAGTATLASADSPPPISDVLNLTALCAQDPDDSRWRIANSSDSEVSDFTLTFADGTTFTENDLEGGLPPGDTVVEGPWNGLEYPDTGPNTAILTAEGFSGEIPKAYINQFCEIDVQAHVVDGPQEDGPGFKLPGKSDRECFLDGEPFAARGGSTGPNGYARTTFSPPAGSFTATVECTPLPKDVVDESAAQSVRPGSLKIETEASTATFGKMDFKVRTNGRPQAWITFFWPTNPNVQTGEIAPDDAVLIDFDTTETGIPVRSEIVFPENQPLECNVSAENRINYSIEHIDTDVPDGGQPLAAEFVVPQSTDVLIPATESEPEVLVGECLFFWVTTFTGPGVGDFQPLYDFDGDGPEEAIALDPCGPPEDGFELETTKIDGETPTTVKRPLGTSESDGDRTMEACIVDGVFDGSLPEKVTKIAFFNDPLRF